MNSELESDQEDGSAGAKKVDAGLVGEYIMTQKKKILAKIEEKEEMFLIHKELSEKLTAQKNEFSEVLKQQVQNQGL